MSLLRYFDVLDWFDHCIQKGKIRGGLIESVIVLRYQHFKLAIFLVLIFRVILAEEGSICACVNIVFIMETDGPMF